jgi:hypothetical protein
MTLIKLVVLVTVIALCGCRIQSPVPTAVSSTSPTSTVVLAGLVPDEDTSTQLQEAGIELFRVELETKEPRAPIENWPAGKVYQLAADYYAVLHEDYDVSVGEVLSSGLWPYKTTPAEANMDARIHSGIMKAAISKRFVDNKSFLRARHEILESVLEQLYGQGATLPIQSPEALTKDARFWQNPRKKAPMTMSKEIGDYWLYPAGDLPEISRFPPSSWVKPEWQFPVINLFTVPSTRRSPD